MEPNYSFRVTSFVLLTSLFLLASCVAERESGRTAPHDPYAGQPDLPKEPRVIHAIVKGENSAVIFEANLQGSIEKQRPPLVWLEFLARDGSRIRTDFPKHVRVELHNLWKATLKLCFRDLGVNDDAQRFELRKEYLNNSAVLIAYLEAQHTSTPSGGRTLEREATEITGMLNYLAIRRFNELKAMDSALQDANTPSISD